MSLFRNRVWLLWFSALLVAITGLLWTQSILSPWECSISGNHGDFHLRIRSDAGRFRFGETHHFEEWRIAYWKLILLSLVPAARYIQLKHYRVGQRGFEVSMKKKS